MYEIIEVMLGITVQINPVQNTEEDLTNLS